MWSSQSRSLCRYSQNSATRSAPGNLLARTAATPGLVAGSAFPPLPDGQTGPAAAPSSGEGENCQETKAPREGTIPARSEHPIPRAINRWPLGQGVGPAQCGCLGGSSQGPFWHQHPRGVEGGLGVGQARAQGATGAGRQQSREVQEADGEFREGTAGEGEFTGEVGELVGGEVQGMWGRHRQVGTEGRALAGAPVQFIFESELHRASHLGKSATVQPLGKKEKA